MASTLERIWLDYLRYGAEEAHALGSDREGVSLWFVTRSGPAASDLCVTGRIRALRRPGALGKRDHTCGMAASPLPHLREILAVQARSQGRRTT